MRLKSFLQFLARPWRKHKPITNKARANRSARLVVEMLEQRELLTGNLPTILTAGVLPVDGSSTTQGLPVIQVQYSETMTNSALNSSNYVLLGSSGNNIPVNSVSFVPVGGAPANSAVQLTYNSGSPLVVDNYTLFVRGDRLTDANDGLAMAQPGQLIVANSGRNNVSVVNMPGDGTLGAMSSYNLPGVGVQAANPNAIALGDLDGDGIKDLVVVNAGTNQVMIYLGQPAAQGGGYHTTPDLTLSLPAGAVNLGKSILLTDLNKDGKLDIVVANVNTANITVFLNTSASAGALSFNSGNSFATDANPVGIVAGDFSGSGSTDLAVAVSTAPSDLGGPTTANDYRVDILPGDGAGNFGATQRIRVGDVTPTSLVAPTSIGAGDFNGDKKLDLAVGGSNGIAILTNTSSVPGTFSFNLQPALLGSSSILSLAVGYLDAGNSPDIVAATSVGTLEVYRNSAGAGPATFLPVSTIAVAAGSAGSVAISDLNGDGKLDIVLSNGAVAGKVSVLQNATFGGSISAATNANPIVVTSASNGLKTGQSVAISGALGNTAANNTVLNPTWTITVLTGAVATANGPGGGSPISINSAANGLATGESVTITGNSFAAANGTFTVTVPVGDPDNFTLNGTSAFGSGTGGAWTSNDRFSLNASIGNAPYTGGATWALAGNITGNIADASKTGPIVITSRNHGLVSGEQVSVAGVLGNTAANNANWTITVVDADHFSLNTSTGNAAYTSGGNWSLVSNITNSTGNTISPIVVTSAGHGLVTGQRVTISGVTGNTAANATFTITASGAVVNATTTIGNPISIKSTNHGLSTGDRVIISGNALAAANGTFTISVTDTNDFTLNGTSAISNSGPFAGGAWTTPDRFSLNGSTGNGAYAGGGLWSLTGNVGGTSANGVSPIVITSNAHGLTTGQSVTIVGVGGNTNANGTWIVTVLTNNTFSLNGPTGGPANYTTGGTWTRNYATSSASNTSPIIITSNNHGLTTGAMVTITGVNGNTNANGTFTVTVLDQDHFFLNGATGNGTYTNGGAWTTGTSFFSPVGSVTAVGLGGASPIAITTTTPHALVNGSQITFAGMAGSLAAVLNGQTFTVTVTDSMHFTLNGTSATGTASGGLFVTSAGVVGPAGGTYTVDATPMGVAIGDINQDGFADVVVANNGGNDFTTFLGNGSGLLQVGANYPVGPTLTSSVAVADFNGDGIPDLAVINNNGNDNQTFVTIYQGLPGGGYAAPVNVSPLASGGGHHMRNLVSITVGDINGDGHPDIAVADSRDNSIGFLKNLITVAGSTITANSFTAMNEVGVGQNPTQVALGDLNNDGKLDLVVAHNGGGGFGGGNKRGITVALGSGDFTFQNGFELDGGGGGFGGGGTPMSGVVVGDFNKDGNLDIIGLEDNAPGNIHLHFGDGKGNFGNNGTFSTSVPNPGAIKAADFNGDGYLDVIVTSKSTNLTNAGVAVLLNQLGTGFGTALQTDVVPGTALQDVVISDVNQDGFADAIVTTQIPNLSGTVTGSTGNGTSPIVINVNSVAGVSVGQTIVVAGVTGNTAANGTFTITGVNGGFGGPRITYVATGNGNYAGGGTWSIVNTGTTINENVFVLTGKGNGTFQSPVPYLVGGAGAPPPAPSYLGVTASSLIRVTTFGSGGTIVNSNLVNNGDFESRDLNNEQGNLLGWQVFNLNTSPGGSVGDWLPQTGTTSPLSGTTVPQPTGKYRAMLDQNNQTPYSGNINPNNAASYQGTHALYQDVTIPANATKASLSLSLYIDNTASGAYSDPATNPSLDFRTSSGGSVLANQQVRIDIMRPGAALTSVGTIPQASGTIANANETGGVNPIVIATAAAHGLATGSLVTISGVLGYAAANGTFTITFIDATHFSLNGTSTAGSASGGAWQVPGDVLRNEFITTPATALTYSGAIQDLDLTAFAGQTIRLRIASANNQGRLIVGVDNVKINVQFADTTPPALTGLNVSNPAFVGAGIPHTNDPTLVGKIADNSGLSSIAFVEFDPNNDGFGGPDDFKITNWDAQGHFRFNLPSTPAGLNTVGVQVVDKAGNAFKTTFTFFMQSNSVTEWEAVGPQGIDTTNPLLKVDFKSVSGRITVTVPDLNDPLGNSYFVGSVNGGIWKTSDGGSTWVSVTNSVTDGSGNPIPVPIGGMAQSKTNPNVLYAATGVGDDALDSRAGVGVLKSVDGGKTWTLIGNSGTVLAGARAVKVVVDNNSPNIAYVGVASDSSGTTGGVYRTLDGGLTWVNILDPAKMSYLTNPTNLGSQTFLAAGAHLDSVTDLILDPSTSNHLVIALGSVGLVPANGTTGVWQSDNASAPSGASWSLVEGGDNAAIVKNGLPNELVAAGGYATARLGRTTVAIGQGRTAAETYLYVLIGTPPGSNVPPSVDWGTFSGLFRSKDVGLNFTKVMLKQNTHQGPSVPGAVNHTFVDINLLSHDAANAGAMIVDPSDPNVVYVGGSSQWGKAGDPPNHELIRVDTGNMDDTSGGNTGEDLSKLAQANKQLVAGVAYYDNMGASPADAYKGEGVYWYDLVENHSGGNGKLDSLPAAITSLSLDAQGRLLVGTIGGIWRGVSYGFGYDFTSGGNGILQQGGGGPGPGPAPFSAPGMTFTSINSNLQIADMTSVAIDPFNRGVYYTTQIGTGVAGSTAPLVWVSQGLTGPSVNGVNLGIPNAGAVLSANPAPGSPAGTPVSLFRIWEYANRLALQPETSNDNGGSWTSINSAGISINASAGIFPAFAIDPNPIFQSGLYQTELAFGANVVYTTDTSGTAWFSTNQVLSAGANISALTFAPSDASAQTLYAATTDGKFFHTVSKGGDNWPEVDTGLPVGIAGTYIRGIAVDPNNANEVFVMYGGTGTADHVFHSTDGGQNWTDVSVLATSNLPNVPAYAMVIDRTVGLGAPIGKLYLATEVGVFYSLNNGSTWTRLGQGMPNVPVVDLKFDGTRASGAVATAVGTGGANPIVITTAASHGRSSGDKVAITGVSGFAAANGNFSITVIDATHFSLDGTTAAGNGTGGAWTVPGLQVLAAATSGRGVYTINTSAFSFITDQTVNENTPSKVIPFTINDPTGATSYTVSAVSDNPFLVLNGAITLAGSGQNRTIQFTPVVNANTPNNGVANITVTITSGGFSYQQSFKVTVNFVNQLPTISTIPTQITLKNQATQVINFTIGDVETPASALVVTASSNNTTLVKNNATDLTLGGSGPNRTLVVTPEPNQVGSAIITVTVTDSNSPTPGITTTNFNLLVTSAATLPFPDNFNRPDSIFLGPGWNTNVGTVTLHNQKASFGAGPDIASLNQLAATDVAVQSDLAVGAGQNMGLIARYNGSNSMYWGALVGIGGSNFTADIWKDVNGNWAQLASTPVKGIAGTITAASNPGSPSPIVITSTAHGLNTGDLVTITGVVGNTAANNTAANPVWTVTVIDADHFSLNGSTGNAAYTGGGAWSHTVTLRLEVASDSLKLFIGSTPASLALVDFTNDASLAGPGTVGYRTSSGNLSADNFAASAVNLTTPSLPFTDLFNQTAGTQLSNNWVNRQKGNFADNGAAMVASAAPVNSLATIYNLNQTNGFAQAEVNVVGANTYAGVVDRYSAGGFYNALIINTGSGFVADIYRFNLNPVTGAVISATEITAGAVPVSSAAGPGPGNGTADGAGAVRLEAVGSSLKMFYGPTGSDPTTLVNYAYDNSFVSGDTGIRGAAGMAIDNFKTGNITLKNPTSLPFTDDFSSAVNTNQLFGNAAQLTPPNERNWQDQAGDFIVTGGVGGKAQSNNGISFATIAGRLGDSSAQADVIVDPALNQQAGVVVRANAGGMYYGQILSVGSSGSPSFVAKILKLDANGNLIAQLGSTSTPLVVSGPNTLRLEAAGPSLKLFYNNALVAYGFDSQFATGTTGMRASKGATTTIDNFTANAITLTAPTVPPTFTDDFSTPNNGNQLSLNWTERQGNFTDNGLTLVSSDPGLSIATVNGVSLADEAAQIDIVTPTSPNQNTSLILRYQANGSYYVAGIAKSGATFTPYMLRYTGAGFTNLLSSTNVPALTLSDTGTMRFEIAGGTLKLFFGPTGSPLPLVAYGYDTSIPTAGLPGLRVSSGLTLDNFVADQIVQTTPSPLPFNDSFSTPATGNSGNQLSRNWDERQGNFTDTGGGTPSLTAAAAGVRSIATVHGVSLADTAVQADVTLAANQHAGLIARYQANGFFYVALLQANSTGTASTAYFFKGTDASLVQIGNPVAVNSVKGTMRFEVIGAELKLFYTPLPGTTESLVNYAYDTAITGPGFTGLRASTGAVINNFFADAVTLVTPAAPPFTDDFSATANTNQLYGNAGGLTGNDQRNWEERAGNFTVNAGNQLVANDPAPSTASIATVHGLALANTTVQAGVILGASQHAGVIARYQANGNFYVALLQADASATNVTPYIFANINGNFSQVGTGSAIVVVAGSTNLLRFEVAGTSLKLFVNGNLAAYGYDSNITAAGLTGIRASKGATYDASLAANIFSADQITLMNPALPFNDPFTGATGATLSRNWTERQGLFNFTGASALQAVAPTVTSIATVNTPVADSSITEDITIPASGTHNFGLVARFDPVTGNTYVGGLIRTNGATTAYILARIGGTFFTLNSATIAATGTGTLRFDVVGTNLKVFWNGALATFANDATFAGPNLSGVYVGAGDSVANFNLSAITLLTPSLPFTDNFNATDGTQLSRKWLDRSGDYGVSGNKIVGNATVNIATVNGLALGAVDADADIIVGNNQHAGVIVRYQANGSFYTGLVASSGNNTFTAYIFRFDAGVPTQLASVLVASGAGTLSLQAVGPNLKLFYGSSLATQSLIAYAYDTTYATGTTGIRSSLGAQLDNFGTAGVNVPTVQPSPFTETFAASPPRQQLSNNWTEHAGNFTVLGGPATGVTGAVTAVNGGAPIAALNGISIATVNGIISANADLSAVVNLAAVNQAAMLIARYSGNPGSDTYYYAKVKNAGASGYAVGIYKVVNGVTTLLSLPNLFVASFTSGIRFLVVNGNLNLYLDGNALPAVTVSDGSIAAAGAVGFGANATVKVSKFTAS